MQNGVAAVAVAITTVIFFITSIVASFLGALLVYAKLSTSKRSRPAGKKTSLPKDQNIKAEAKKDVAKANSNNKELAAKEFPKGATDNSSSSLQNKTFDPLETLHSVMDLQTDAATRPLSSRQISSKRSRRGEEPQVETLPNSEQIQTIAESRLDDKTQKGMTSRAYDYNTSEGSGKTVANALNLNGGPKEVVIISKDEPKNCKTKQTDKENENGKKAQEDKKPK